MRATDLTSAKFGEVLTGRAGVGVLGPCENARDCSATTPAPRRRVGVPGVLRIATSAERSSRAITNVRLCRCGKSCRPPATGLGLYYLRVRRRPWVTDPNRHEFGPGAQRPSCSRTALRTALIVDEVVGAGPRYVTGYGWSGGGAAPMKIPDQPSGLPFGPYVAALAAGEVSLRFGSPPTSTPSRTPRSWSSSSRASSARAAARGRHRAIRRPARGRVMAGRRTVAGPGAAQS
jgi:hypothetical protein